MGSGEFVSIGRTVKNVNHRHKVKELCMHTGTITPVLATTVEKSPGMSGLKTVE